MKHEEILAKLSEYVFEGDPEMVAEWTDKAIAEGLEPMTIINDGMTKGIEKVGEHFAAGDYFLPDLILGAKAMDEGIKKLEPLLAGKNREYIGRVVVGTVAGDLHTIGKNIVIMMLKTAGFEVFDLGVDVPSETFIEKAKEYNVDIVGISALLTTTVARQKEILELLDGADLRKKIKVIIGGAPITQSWADKIGADAYAPDASAAVNIARRFVGVGA